jgi:YesN/AraC family two-component response regulator
LASLVGKRIVIIEDEGLTLLGIRRTCEQARMIVAGVAYNGQEGVEIALQQRPDIILTDIRMPQMDGLEAVRQIVREMRVCIVLVTAYADTTDLGKILELGVHGYLVKPVTKDVLLPALEDAYERFQEGKIFGF